MNVREGRASGAMLVRRAIRPLTRLGRAALAASLLFSMLLVPSPSVRGAGVWYSVESLNVTTTLGTLTLLSDGRVLVTGSYTAPAWAMEAMTSTAPSPPAPVPTAQPGLKYFPAAEVYNPVADRWTAVAQVPPAQGSMAPVLLPDGRVLFTGGYSVPSTPSSFYTLEKAQTYSPTTNVWTPVAPMAVSRFEHTSTLLRDGTVLVVGGRSGRGERPGAMSSSERYDPGTNRWSPSGNLGKARSQHTATLLNDGRVLVVGGYDPVANDFVAAAEMYDPATGSWSSAGNMLSRRAGHTTVLLADGQVLVVGGYDREGPVLTAELYDPATNSWRSAAPMTIPRTGFVAILLPGGRVLVAGGLSVSNGVSGRVASTPLSSTELYDPATGKWAGEAPMTVPRAGALATLLHDGSVLVVSQPVPASSNPQPPATAEKYTRHPVMQTCFPQTGKCIQGIFGAYWQAHGGLAINGYPISDEFIQVLEDGRAYQVQYFERVRMEYHAENSRPYDVLLGQFGRRIHPADPASAPQPGASYFSETGHNLSGSFLAYWRANGGLMQFGFPITEEFSETLEDGHTYVVQYFERARFEHHPENRPPYDVLLGHFGRRILGQLIAEP